MMVTPLYPADKYTYRVLWSEEDQQYVGVCSEFPLLSHLAGSPAEALDGVVMLVRTAIADMQKTMETAPIPLAIRRLGGRR
jgi:predicted RNase H-like HicB family nuclease